MARPEFPTGTILPASCIRRIREEQDYYDEDPERYEREGQQEKERRDEEERQLNEEWQRQQQTND